MDHRSIKSPIILVKNLSVVYGDTAVLKDISLEIPSGECVLITGPSGCGKSTLVRALTGLIPHAIAARMEGQVRVAGMEVHQASIADLARHVGTVFQNPITQLFHLRVDDEVAFGGRNLDLPEDEVRRRVEWALESVGLQGLEGRRPAELSGGQQQRLAIAAALAMQPKILVLDEPTASLDVPGTHQVLATLRELKERLGLTIVLIEQRLAEAVRLADRIVVMAEGEIVADDEPKRVLSKRDILRQLGIRRPGSEPLVEWASLLRPDGQHSERCPPMLELRGISAGYNSRAVIEDINLQLFPGEFVALVGDNGAGKSTLGLVTAGLIKPRHGKVIYEGGQRPRGGLDVALLFQNPADQLFTDRVEEEVAFAPRNYGRFHADQHHQILEQLDLLALRERRPTALSAGQQQRTALASCLALRPHLVILDEPTMGQDWGHLQRLMSFLEKLNQEGTTILLITHDYKLVYRYARRAILMKSGRIVMDGGLRQGRRAQAKLVSR
jgi:energy-coupling factor transporter ATP-binding protein EcfA2